MLVRMKVLALFVILTLQGCLAMFHYTSESCDDLMPRYMPMKESKPEPEPEPAPEEDDMNNMTSKEPPTTTPEPEPEPEPTLEKGDGDPPARLRISDAFYRRNRKITVTLKSNVELTGFVIQARLVSTDNITRVGAFEKIPKQTAIKDCGESDSRVIGDNGMDRKGLDDITLTWASPNKNMGSIQFVAGILINNTYYIVKSEEMSFKDYPIDTSSCGTDMMCYRSCSSHKSCPAYMSDYVFTSKVDPKGENLIMTLGAYLPNNSSYVAIGFTNDSDSLSNSDITACLRDQDSSKVISAHYILEKYGGAMEIDPAGSRTISDDYENDYLWCTFTRPLRGPGSDALTLAMKLYHFYMVGEHNYTEPIIPEWDRIMFSSRPLNFTETNDFIVYNSAGLPRSSVWILLPFLFTLMYQHHF